MSWSTDGSVEGWTTNGNNQNYSFIFLFILNLVKMKPFLTSIYFFQMGGEQPNWQWKNGYCTSNQLLSTIPMIIILYIILYCMYLWLICLEARGVGETHQGTAWPRRSENWLFVCGRSFGSSFAENRKMVVALKECTLAVLCTYWYD